MFQIPVRQREEEEEETPTALKQPTTGEEYERFDATLSFGCSSHHVGSSAVPMPNAAHHMWIPRNRAERWHTTITILPASGVRTGSIDLLLPRLTLPLPLPNPACELFHAR